MPDAYEVYEARFLMEGGPITSAANATTIDGLTCPANRVWTILSASYNPSVAETQTVLFYILSRSGIYYPITQPVSIALSGTILFPLVREGMELKIFPGEKIGAFRGAATAGSTMTIAYRFIESALPLYEEYEPQVRRSQIRKRSSSGTRSIGGGFGGGGGEGEPPPPGPTDLLQMTRFFDHACSRPLIHFQVSSLRVFGLPIKVDPKK